MRKKSNQKNSNPDAACMRDFKATPCEKAAYAILANPFNGLAGRKAAMTEAARFIAKKLILDTIKEVLSVESKSEDLYLKFFFEKKKKEKYFELSYEWEFRDKGDGYALAEKFSLFASEEFKEGKLYGPFLKKVEEAFVALLGEPQSWELYKFHFGEKFFEWNKDIHYYR